MRIASYSSGGVDHLPTPVPLPVIRNPFTRSRARRSFKSNSTHTAANDPKQGKKSRFMERELPQRSWLNTSGI